MDFYNRQYDPQIGRFLSVDPLAAATVSMSPYTGMNNDPAGNSFLDWAARAFPKGSDVHERDDKTYDKTADELCLPVRMDKTKKEEKWATLIKNR